MPHFSGAPQQLEPAQGAAAEVILGAERAGSCRRQRDLNVRRRLRLVAVQGSLARPIPRGAVAPAVHDLRPVLWAAGPQILPVAQRGHEPQSLVLDRLAGRGGVSLITGERREREQRMGDSGGAVREAGQRLSIWALPRGRTAGAVCEQQFAAAAGTGEPLFLVGRAVET